MWPGTQSEGACPCRPHGSSSGEVTGGRGRAGRGAGGTETDPDTRTKNKGWAGDGQEGGQSKGHVLERRFSLGTPRTPVANAAAKGLTPPGDGQSPHSALHSQDRLPCALQRSRPHWGRAEPVGERRRGACWVATPGGGQQGARTCRAERHPTQGHSHGSTPRHSSLTFWCQN